MSNTVAPHSSFIVPYHVTDGGVLMVVQNNPKHGFHLVGGKHEQYESSAECLARELHEELGLKEFLLTDFRVTHQEEIPFHCADMEVKATLYAIEMSIEDVYKFAHELFPDTEFELTVLDTSVLSNERTKTSKVAELAISWLNDHLREEAAVFVGNFLNCGDVTNPNDKVTVPSVKPVISVKSSAGGPLHSGMTSEKVAFASFIYAQQFVS